MGAQLLDEIRQFLHGLERAQEELSTLYAEKRTALIHGRSDDLMRIAQTESTLADTLKSLLDRRGQILDQARRSGVDADSILTLVGAAGGDDRVVLEPRIQQLRRSADELRRETWIHWIIAHRAYSHYSELLELVAHSGKNSPTYDQKSNEASSGGAIFDASV